MDEHTANAWKSPELTRSYLSGVRGAIPLADVQIDVMLRLLEANGRPVDSFLDLGCGSGVLAAALLQRFPAAHGVLLDFSPPMLDAAREQLAPYGDQIAYVLADYGEPHWQATLGDAPPFDVIVSGFSIHHQPDQRKRSLYVELFGLLQPGGFFINVEHVASATGWLEERFEDYLIDALLVYHRRLGSCKTRAEVAHEFYHRPDKDANILTLVERQCRWLRESGFQDVDCYLKVFELAVFGGRKPDVTVA